MFNSIKTTLSLTKRYTHNTSYLKLEKKYNIILQENKLLKEMVENLKSDIKFQERYIVDIDQVVIDNFNSFIKSREKLDNM